MAEPYQGFDRLDGAGRALAAVAVRPRGVVYVALVSAIALSWLALGLMAARQAGVESSGMFGPGAGLLALLPDVPLPQGLERFFMLCLTPASLEVGGAVRFAVLALMWLLMSVAMMLPSAVPMIRTYCEIADTAAAKGEKTVHPLVLACGYLCAWVFASLVFAAASLAVGSASGGLGPGPVGVVASAAALALAGLYQFSGLKETCLKKCRDPFAILFARWSTELRTVFKLGLEQGAWCVGCCWALMLVMFAVGVMNVFWMALLAVFAVVEKQVASRLPGRLAGAILLVWSAALLVGSA